MTWAQEGENSLSELFSQITYHFIDFFMLNYCGITFPQTRPQLIKLYVYDLIWCHVTKWRAYQKQLATVQGFWKYNQESIQTWKEYKGLPAGLTHAVCVTSLQLWFWTNNTCTAHVSTTLSELRLLYVMIYSAFPRYTDFCSHRNCMA